MSKINTIAKFMVVMAVMALGLGFGGVSSYAIAVSDSEDINTDLSYWVIDGKNVKYSDKEQIVPIMMELKGNDTKLLLEDIYKIKSVPTIGEITNIVLNKGIVTADLMLPQGTTSTDIETQVKFDSAKCVPDTTSNEPDEPLTADEQFMFDKLSNDLIDGTIDLDYSDYTSIDFDEEATVDVPEDPNIVQDWYTSLEDPTRDDEIALMLSYGLVEGVDYFFPEDVEDTSDTCIFDTTIQNLKTSTLSFAKAAEVLPAVIPPTKPELVAAPIVKEERVTVRTGGNNIYYVNILVILFILLTQFIKKSKVK